MLNNKVDIIKNKNDLMAANDETTLYKDILHSFKPTEFLDVLQAKMTPNTLKIKLLISYQ